MSIQNIVIANLTSTERSYTILLVGDEENIIV